MRMFISNGRGEHSSGQCYQESSGKGRKGSPGPGSERSAAPGSVLEGLGIEPSRTPVMCQQPAPEAHRKGTDSHAGAVSAWPRQLGHHVAAG